VQGPHVPDADPTASSQVSPAQQSALFVQGLQALSQVIEPQMYGGVPASFGMQGRPSQQSALEAQEAPALRHFSSVQRGTPSLSGLQVSFVSQLPEQQSHEALQDIVASLQTSPLGLHPFGLRHTPTVAGGVISQVTGLCDPPGRPVPPQQSVSFVQRSPTTWQPVAGWQTSVPVGP
jgi:hypothetical protein